MVSHYYCVIMAGGVGSRFWPLSRSAKPKQFIDALGIGKTFIQMTFERFARFIPAENFLVVTGEAYKDLVKEQLPMLADEQILTEPCRRNTAPCVAYASYRIAAQDPDAVMIVTPSDHYIHQETEFVEVMQKATVYAEQHPELVTVGIKPTYPATGYGYIQKAKSQKGRETGPEDGGIVLELGRICVELRYVCLVGAFHLHGFGAICPGYSPGLPHSPLRDKRGARQGQSDL